MEILSYSYMVVKLTLELFREEFMNKEYLEKLSLEELLKLAMF